MSDKLNKIKEKLAELEKKKSEALEIIRKDFPSIFDDLFERSILINSIAWTQYTPYFMDGDECIFGINADELEVNGINPYDEEEAKIDWIEQVKFKYLKTEEELKEFIDYSLTKEGKSYKTMAEKTKIGGYGYLPNPHYNKEESNILNEFSEVIYTIPEDFMRSLFGDHVKVTVKRDGTIHTSEYEHD